MSIESGGGRETAGDARSSCWASPRLIGKVCGDKGGHGVIAAASIEPGELIALFGGAPLVSAQLGSLSSDQRRRVLQVDDDLYLFSEVESMADWVNHSCEPNAGLRGQIALVALRPIKAGEEISYDYAMSDGSPYDGFACRCGTTVCRGQVTGDDWKLESLWAEYDGHFSPYLAARIARLRKRQAAPRSRARRLTAARR